MGRSRSRVSIDHGGSAGSQQRGTESSGEFDRYDEPGYAAVDRNVDRARAARKVAGDRGDGLKVAGQLRLQELLTVVQLYKALGGGWQE